MSEQIGVAVVGCGYWGINHVRVFHELPEARVVAVCDQSEARLAEVRRRFPDTRLTTSLAETLQMPEVDAVVVCTSAVNHFQLAQQCLRSGRDVLIEKPITTTSHEAEELVELAAAHGRILMVGHTFLYNAGVRKVKEYLTHDRIGRIYYMSSTRTNLGPFRYDVNALWDLAPHDVSIFNYLLDSAPEWVSAVGASVLKPSREDVGFVALGYPNGVLAHIHVSWVNPNKVREIVVVGSRQRIVFDDISSAERVRVFEKGVQQLDIQGDEGFGEYRLQVQDGDIISPKIDASEPLKNECRHFVECALYRHQPLTDGYDGLRVVQVMEAIEHSLARRGAPVEVGNFVSDRYGKAI
jgi:predicted dehydrogenase